VRIVFYCSLVGALSVALFGIPAMATPPNPASAPLGVVLQADRAQVGADITSGGATIYDGDRLETDAQGTLRVRLGGPQMYLRPGTAAEVHNLSKGFSASLMHGTVVVSSAAGEAFELLADGATIRPAGSQPTIAQVTWVDANELLLTSSRGAIEVSIDGEVKTIEAGNSYRMEIQPDDSDAQDKGNHGSGQVPVGGGRRRKRAIFFWIAAIGVGTAIGVWRATVSPDTP
jgi:hypothetical protein